LSFNDADELRGTDSEPDQQSFEQTIVENLRAAGIQNGRRRERLEFESLETFAGEYLQAVGQRKRSDSGEFDAPEVIAIAIGPQYGTVGPSFVKAAVREAVRANIGLVAVLGFAFDPQATGVIETDGMTVVAGEAGFATVEGERTLGRAQVLFVRMNVDLLMGEELKKSKTGNLFTVFGEPDIEVQLEGDKYVVELKGVDVYDPISGDVRSNSTGEIALWMLDTDYNEESFFVRHAYFTGDNDPFKQLKMVLKADIDTDAWEAMYRTTSMPFVAPSSGKIAVKVINDYGDEVMKVIEVGLV
jgi:adenine-specific DNA-methyltransferase